MMKKGSNKSNSGSFDDLTGKSRKLEIDELTKDIKIDGNPTGYKFNRSSKSYLSSSNEVIGTVSNLGTVVKFCQDLIQRTPDFA
jgi:hypothetical protein